MREEKGRSRGGVRRGREVKKNSLLNEIHSSMKESPSIRIWGIEIRKAEHPRTDETGEMGVNHNFSTNVPLTNIQIKLLLFRPDEEGTPH